MSLVAAFSIMTATVVASNSENLYRKSPIKSVNPDTMPPLTKELYNNWKELEKRQLSLLPVPKKIKFEGTPVTLGDNAVIILKDRTPKGMVAVHEINSMVKEFSGKTLEVYNVPQKNRYNIIIDNMGPSFFTGKQGKLILTQNPYCRNQAYMIEPVKNGIRLTGNSSIGMLYAAVSLRFLISGDTSGNALLHPAFIADWPDIPRRRIMTLRRWANFYAVYKKQYGKNPTSKEYLTFAKKQYDLALRLKINVVYGGVRRLTSVFSIYNASRSLKNKKSIAMASVLGKYARERGIKSMGGIHSHLGHPRSADEERPELKGCMVNCHGVFSWGKLDLHKKKAAKVAQFCKLYNIDMLVFHTVDAGGVFDPQTWSLRDKFTKAKFGNDMKTADLAVINIYLDALKGSGVEMNVVLHPYSPFNFNADTVLKLHGLSPTSRKFAQKTIEKNINYQRELIKSLPAGTPVTIREDPKELVDNMMEKVVKDNPVVYYMEPWKSYRYGFVRLLPMTFSSISTIYNSERKVNDILKTVTGFSGLPSIVYAAEYAWNCKFPGDSDLNEGKDYAFDAKRDPALEDIIASRAAAGLWRGTASSKLKEVLKDNISLSIGVMPYTLHTKRRFKNFIAMLRKNQMTLEKANNIMDEVWSEMASVPQVKRNRIITSTSRPEFVKFRLLYKAALAWNYARLAYEEAMNAISGGDMVVAEKSLADGLKKLKQAESAYQKAEKEMAEEPTSMLRSGLIEYYLTSPEFDKMFKLLTELKKSKEEIFRKQLLPAWYKKSMTRKPLPMLTVKNGPKIDGSLDDAVWKKAFPIENFVGVKTPLSPVKPVIMKLLADDKYLYFGGKIVQPGLSKINIPKRSSNMYKSAESAELFILSNSKGKVYYHFMIDAGGNLFTEKCKYRKLKSSIMPFLKAREGILYKVIKSPGSWSFEVRIPWSKMSEFNRKKARGVVCYNRDLGKGKRFNWFSSSWLVGHNYHWIKGYGPIKSVKKINPKDLQADTTLCLSGIKAKNITTAYGAGTNVAFNVRITSKRPMTDLKLKVKITDKSEKIIKSLNIQPAKKYSGVIFVSTKQHIQFPVEHKTLKIEMNVDFKTLDGTVCKKTLKQIVKVNSK